MARTRALPAVLATALALAACGSSSTHTSEPPPTTTAPSGSRTTVDPQELNSIPYNVGETIGLPGGWRVQAMRVRRGYTASGLPAAPAGQVHVAVDIRVANDEAPPTKVDAAALFTLYDPSNSEHPAVAVAGEANGLDAMYATGSEHTGMLVFPAPAHGELRMVFAGEKIGSQRSVFQIDPPKVKPHD